MRILVMGLPGAGKTTLANALCVELFPNCLWLNADVVRKQFDDWDFSHEGRIRQASRMRDLADNSDKSFVIADFVCPLPEMREIFSADFTIWVDTISEGRFADTNQVFVPPEKYDVRMLFQNTDRWLPVILKSLDLSCKHRATPRSIPPSNDR